MSMDQLIAVKPTILSAQSIPQVHPELAKSLNLDLTRHTSIAIITCDQDDSLYAALDHATKHAQVDVVYAKSFYAGANHASGPYSGEAIGILAAATPDDINEGLYALQQALENDICFYQFADSPKGPAFFPHLIPSVGYFLAKEAKVEVGAALAYLIAPPMESVVGIDLALKAAKVRLVKYFGPPTETNFGGAYLVGELTEVEAARAAFIEGVYKVASNPLSTLRRPDRLRR